MMSDSETKILILRDKIARLQAQIKDEHINTDESLLQQLNYIKNIMAALKCHIKAGSCDLAIQKEYSRFKKDFQKVLYHYKLTEIKFDSSDNLIDDNSIDYQNESEYNEPEFDKYEYELAQYRNKKIKDVNEGVEKIALLNDYIDSLVKMQGRTVDHVVYKMRMDAIRTGDVVDEFTTTLVRKRRKRKVKKIFLYVICFFIFAFVMKITIAAVINKFL